MKTKLLVFIFTFALSINDNYCQNLVPNPSFEDYTTCPDNLAQLHYVNSWYSASNGTPDYYNSCANPSLLGVPNNVDGSQAAKDGQAYIGIYGGGGTSQNGNGHREYIQVELLEPLIEDEFYNYKFHVSLADDYSYAVNGMGVLFS